jgi:predicted translin family RNA/ssDNA-binding protein
MTKKEAKKKIKKLKKKVKKWKMLYLTSTERR